MNATSATDTDVSTHGLFLRAGMKARPLSDIMHDAIMLHAFAQGVYELHDTIKTDLSPASNAMPAMFDSLIERAHRLAEDIEVYDYVQTPK